MSKKVKETEKVAQSYKILYENGDKKGLKEFLEQNLRESDKKEIDAELKKTIPLRRIRRVKIGRPQIQPKGHKKRPNKKSLTAREKRDLGLYKLPKKGSLKYEDMKPLNTLWKNYLENLVDFSKADESSQIRLCRADYLGAEVRVTKSKCSSLLGLKGFVAMETRNTLRIISEDNVLKTVPKKNNSFTFVVNEKVTFSVSGSNMIMKPSERAVKKWKNKMPMDI